MGVIRRITDLQLGSILTSKVLSITSAETLYQISSGVRAVELANQGTAALLYYGQSGVTVNSAGIVINTGGGAKFWDTIVDNFQLALRTNSIGVVCTVIAHEYGGNN